MTKVKFSHKVIAVFLTLNFLTTIIPFNLLHAGNNGPGSAEAAGFEPVDASDMVSLSTGDFTYVLPLLDVEGFPVNLSYHAGMSQDIDASWVGLGWYLNPGAINRSVNGTPDDWKGGIGINFNSFKDEVTTSGVTVDVGFPGASVGVGMNWGSGQGMSGSVRASVGLGSILGDMGGVGASVSASTSGDVTVGVGAGVQIGSFGAGASVSYSLTQQQFSLGVGVGMSTGDSGVKGFENSSVGLGVSMSEGGGMAIGAGYNAYGDKGSASGGVGMSSASFSQGDASVDVQSTAVALPLHIVGIPLTLGFSKRKVTIKIRKGFYNEKWGALYSSDYYGYSSGSPLITNSQLNYNHIYGDYVVRTKSLDTYSTRLPQAEEDFISDYSKTIENINFTFMSYDNYNVASQGMMGNMSPKVFQSSTIFGEGQRTKNQAEDNIHVFWHHGNLAQTVNRKFGDHSNGYNENDFYFYFDGQFSSRELTQDATINSSSVSSSTYMNQIINPGIHNGVADGDSGYYGRAKTPRYVETFTNQQIASGHAQARGLINPATVDALDRQDQALFDPNGIGAYKITAPDGKTYHFALPVYHFEQVHRAQIDAQESNTFDIRNVNEKRQYSRFATHWLLTAITGPDYIDRPDPNGANVIGTFNKEDYGYWVELEYGKWSDGFVWRTPYKDGTYNYNTNVKGKIEDKDKGGYAFGRKQMYYLDKINTRNRTALFIKDIRYDALGKNLKFKFSNSNAGGGPTIGTTVGSSKILNQTNRDVNVRETGVEYKREYSLKLDKIVLVNSDVGKNLLKNTPGSMSTFYGSNYSANDTCTPNWDSADFNLIYDSNLNDGIKYSYVIHNEQDVLTTNDLPSQFVQNNALKVVELGHEYKLAKHSDSSTDAPDNSPNGKDSYGNDIHAKLTLRSVKIKGKGGADYVPATTFEYYMEEMPNVETPIPQKVNLGWPTYEYAVDAQAIQDHIEEKKSKIDAWGFLQDTDYSSDNEIKAWSLKKINTPTGASIEVDYEEDDYWTEAFSRRYWTQGLEAKFTQENGQKFIYFRQNDDVITDETIYFNKYFDGSEKVYLDTQYFRNPSCSSCSHRVADFAGLFDIVWVTATEVKIALPSDTNSTYRNNSTCGTYPWAFTRNYCCTSSTASVVDRFVNYRDSFGKKCGWESNSNKHFSYKLLANKVPEDETGGGLRVKQIITYDGTKSYKVNYDYTNPFNTDNFGNPRSSGITSYAPVNGAKFVPYQTEVPPPGVMYEYITMKETSSDGEYYSKTRYRHHVLKPVPNIFSPDIEMEALSADPNSGEESIFWASVDENYGGLDGTNTRKIEGKKIDININTALIGQIKSIESFNSENQLLFKTENKYINGNSLNSVEPNKGYARESFNSMKSVFETNNDGNVVNNVKRLLSVSSKTEYNNMLKTTITTAGGHSQETEFYNVDPWLGSFRTSRTELSNGSVKYDSRYPAYTKYPEMGSKVLNPTNKNMLTQEAMSVTTVDTYVLNASINTWNDDWIYRDDSGNEYSPSSSNEKVWRKHKTFVWKDDINPVTGTYLTTVSDYNPYFNWSTGTPTSDKWQNISEITRYNHWSLPLETRDINNNFASSKMADNKSKVIAGGNARYTEMYYSGAEYVSSGNTFEGEVYGANFRTNDIAHTGEYSVKNNSANDKVFEVSGVTSANHNDLSNDFRPGKYKVSFWSHDQKDVEAASVIINGSTVPFAETVDAGCWKLFNFYVELQPNSNFELFVTNTSGGGFYFDDFRMHPVYSSMNSFVYDKNTDELLYIMDANNMGSAFRYDEAGRLKATYKEVESTDVFEGGFKIMGQYKQHYQNTSGINIDYNEDINNCITQSFDPLKLKGLVRNCTPQYYPYDIQYAMHVYGGSGNYKYEWQYLTDIDTGQYTNWYQGSEYEFIPYENKYCSENEFDKLWFVKAKVTDLVTGESITANNDYSTSGCPGYIINPKLMLGVEASYCHGNCEDSKYKFHLYPLDLSLPLPDNIGYIDNNTGNTNFVDLVRGDGLFCPQIKYVESASCKSNYIEYVSITPIHSDATDYTYEFYLNCVSGEVNNELILGSAPDPKYTSPGMMIIKQGGKIVSVIDTNKK
ncbi:hypothetical protein [Winogradskyella sp. MIT101101]|uniref:hypothetical protein n=1 Tax=Winogradskyella sp. MIT101101 TaxID=3098297 RepID=UPI00399A88D8